MKAGDRGRVQYRGVGELIRAHSYLTGGTWRCSSSSARGALYLIGEVVLMSRKPGQRHPGWRATASPSLRWFTRRPVLAAS